MALYIGIKNLIGNGAAWLRSKWSTIVTQLKATFRYRVAGGSDNALLPERNGRAIIDKIYGSTVKWNQLASLATNEIVTVDGLTFTKQANGTVRVTGTPTHTGIVIYKSVSIIGGHKLAIHEQTYNTGDTVAIAYGSYFRTGGAFNGLRIVTPTTPPSYIGLYFSVITAVDIIVPFQIFDLTAAEIDNLTTVEEVEAWLALNVGAQDYYPYDKGSLVSFKGSALQVKKDGAVIDEVDLSGAYINVWDEEWENGIYNSTNGEPVNTQQFLNQIRSKNRIKVLPNTPYFCNQPGSKGLNVLFYDAEDNYITGKNKWNIQRFTTPENAYYLRFYFASVYGNTYNHDICINVSNTDINGTYYPHALQSAGSAMDEVTETQTIKNVGSIDLGTLNWKIANRDGNYFGYALISDAKKVEGSATYIYINSVNSDYILTNRDAIYSGTEGYSMDGSTNVYIYLLKSSLNSSTTTKEAFKAAMSEVYLNYELATPIVVPHDTPMQYAVDKYSTEELLVPASVAGEPTSTALVADIEYQAK